MTSLVWIAVAVIVVIGIIAAVLMSRRTRLRGLPDESRARYADNWRVIETRFVDHPREAVDEADRLAVSIYRERGARLDDGKRMPQDLEKARELARTGGGDEEHADRGDAELGQTEHLRRAMVAYQRIVDKGVGESTRRASEARRREVT